MFHLSFGRKIHSIFKALAFVFLLSFGTNAFAITCGSNEFKYIDTANNNAEKCIESKFEITTTSDTDSFEFKISAAGVFYVDWGDGRVDPLPRTGKTYINIYSHTYATAGSYTIKFGGGGVYDATTNPDGVTKYNTDDYTATISFNRSGGDDSDANAVKIASIHGSLGALFPTIGDATGMDGGSSALLQIQPRFEDTFRKATNLTGEIPADLFSGISGQPVKNMFRSTFKGCTALTGTSEQDLNNSGMNYAIPPTLFSGLSGKPAVEMFKETFYNCSSLTGTIPENLFSGISGQPAERMFSYMFSGCSSLTGTIPENLFSGISGQPASGMFAGVFSSCRGLTGEIPGNLFSGISGQPASGMFQQTFYGCSGLTGEIPSGLFSGISGQPVQNMFYGTFNGCSGLTGEIPSGLFGDISGQPQGSMFKETFKGCSGLAGPIPNRLFGDLSGNPRHSMFYGTFEGCSGLTGIPSGLFGVLSGQPATSMFERTFYGCSGLTGEIPSGLFGVLSGQPAYSMFFCTFDGCKNLTGSIPSGLFGNLYGQGANYAFYRTFDDCQNLTGPIPDRLFGSLSSVVGSMFSETFYRCFNLGKDSIGGQSKYYVPSNLFAGISADASLYRIFNDTGLLTKCPSGTEEYSTPLRQKWCTKTFDNYCPTYTEGIETGYAISCRGLNTITYHNVPNDVINHNPDNYYADNLPFPLNNLSRAGYTFDGWCTDSTLTNCSTNMQIPAGTTGTQEFWAKWTTINYTITYNLNGGTQAPNQSTTYNGDVLPLTLEAPTRDGYLFDGWYDQPIVTDGSPITEISSGSSGNKEYWAKWLPIYTITYNNVPNDVTNDNLTSYTTKSSFPITLTNLSRDGYMFGGWCTDSTLTNCSTNRQILAGTTGDQEFWAKWIPIYTITYNDMGATESANNISQYYYNPQQSNTTIYVYYQYPTSTSWNSQQVYNDTVSYHNSSLQSPTKTGFSFNGWCMYSSEQPDATVAANCNNPINKLYWSDLYNNQGNKWMYAKWTPINYSIYYNLNGGTQASGHYTTYNVEQLPLTLKTPTYNGYTFAGWCTDSTLTNCLTNNQIPAGTTGNQTFYAKWTATPYTITYNTNGGTCSGGCSPTTYYVTSSTITLPTPTKTGFLFAGWYDLSGTRITTIPTNSTGDKTFNAKWVAAEYVFSVTTAPMSAGEYVAFTMSAKGVYSVDWGDGTIEPIDRSNTTTKMAYSHTYQTATTTGWTIRFAGETTGYYNGGFNSSCSYQTNTSAISFHSCNSIYSQNENKTVSLNPTKIVGMSGKLGKLFPTLGNTSNYSYNSSALYAMQPRFPYTFYTAQLTGPISEDLFDGIYGQPTDYMFYYMFGYNRKLTGGLPAGLAHDLSGYAPRALDYMFTYCNYLFRDVADYNAPITYYPSSLLFYGVTGGSSNTLTGTDFYQDYCPTGTSSWYSNKIGSYTCIPVHDIICPAGQRLNSGATSCSSCSSDECKYPALYTCSNGLYGNDSNNRCVSIDITCEPGQFLDGKPYQCHTCYGGSYCPGKSSTGGNLVPGDGGKYKCPDNTYSPSGSTSLSDCSICPWVSDYYVSSSMYYEAKRFYSDFDRDYGQWIDFNGDGQQTKDECVAMLFTEPDDNYTRNECFYYDNASYYQENGEKSNCDWNNVHAGQVICRFDPNTGLYTDCSDFESACNDADYSYMRWSGEGTTFATALDDALRKRGLTRETVNWDDFFGNNVLETSVADIPKSNMCCNSGTYFDASNETPTCSACPAGKWCPSAGYSLNSHETAGIKTCPANAITVAESYCVCPDGFWEDYDDYGELIACHWAGGQCPAPKVFNGVGRYQFLAGTQSDTIDFNGDGVSTVDECVIEMQAVDNVMAYNYCMNFGWDSQECDWGQTGRGFVFCRYSVSEGDYVCSDKLKICSMAEMRNLRQEAGDLDSMEEEIKFFRHKMGYASFDDMFTTSLANLTPETFTPETFTSHNMCCGDGKYFDVTSGAPKCKTCPAGSFCPSAGYSLTGTQNAGINACPAGTTSVAGSATCDCGNEHLTFGLDYKGDNTYKCMWDGECPTKNIPEPLDPENHHNLYGRQITVSLSDDSSIENCMLYLMSINNTTTWNNCNDDGACDWADAGTGLTACRYSIAERDYVCSDQLTMCDAGTYQHINSFMGKEYWDDILMFMRERMELPVTNVDWNDGTFFKHSLADVDSVTFDDLPESYNTCCPVGSYQDESGATPTCTTCPAGKVCCDAGTFLDGYEGCFHCEGGSYCPGGSWPEGTTTDAGVVQCPANTFNPSESSTNATACHACPDGTTSEAGSSYCQCPDGFEWDENKYTCVWNGECPAFNHQVDSNYVKVNVLTPKLDFNGDGKETIDECFVTGAIIKNSAAMEQCNESPKTCDWMAAGEGIFMCKYDISAQDYVCSKQFKLCNYDEASFVFDSGVGKALIQLRNKMGYANWDEMFTESLENIPMIGVYSIESYNMCCADGKYLDTSGNTPLCKSCPAGSFCLSAGYPLNSTQDAGINACPDGSTSVAGSATCDCGNTFDFVKNEITGEYQCQWDKGGKECPEFAPIVNWENQENMPTSGAGMFGISETMIDFNGDEINTVDECVYRIYEAADVTELYRCDKNVENCDFAKLGGGIAFCRYDTSIHNYRCTDAVNVCDTNTLAQYMSSDSIRDQMNIMRTRMGLSTRYIDWNDGTFFKKSMAGIENYSINMLDKYNMCCNDGTYFDKSGSVPTCSNCPVNSYCLAGDYALSSQSGTGINTCGSGAVSSGASSVCVCSGNKTWNSQTNQCETSCPTGSNPTNTGGNVLIINAQYVDSLSACARGYAWPSSSGGGYNIQACKYNSRTRAYDICARQTIAECGDLSINTATTTDLVNIITGDKYKGIIDYVVDGELADIPQYNVCCPAGYYLDYNSATQTAYCTYCPHNYNYCPGGSWPADTATVSGLNTCPTGTLTHAHDSTAQISESQCQSCPAGSTLRCRNQNWSVVGCDTEGAVPDYCECGDGFYDDYTNTCKWNWGYGCPSINVEIPNDSQIQIWSMGWLKEHYPNDMFDFNNDGVYTIDECVYQIVFGNDFYDMDAGDYAKTGLSFAFCKYDSTIQDYVCSDRFNVCSEKTYRQFLDWVDEDGSPFERDSVYWMNYARAQMGLPMTNIDWNDGTFFKNSLANISFLYKDTIPYGNMCCTDGQYFDATNSVKTCATCPENYACSADSYPMTQTKTAGKNACPEGLVARPGSSECGCANPDYEIWDENVHKCVVDKCPSARITNLSDGYHDVNFEYDISPMAYNFNGDTTTLSDCVRFAVKADKPEKMSSDPLHAGFRGISLCKWDDDAQAYANCTRPIMPCDANDISDLMNALDKGQNAVVSAVAAKMGKQSLSYSDFFTPASRLGDGANCSVCPIGDNPEGANADTIVKDAEEISGQCRKLFAWTDNRNNVRMAMCAFNTETGAYDLCAEHNRYACGDVEKVLALSADSTASDFWYKFADVDGTTLQNIKNIGIDKSCCAAGYYGTVNTCTACPVDTYNPDFGATNVSDCHACSGTVYTHSDGGASKCYARVKFMDSDQTTVLKEIHVPYMTAEEYEEEYYDGALIIDDVAVNITENSFDLQYWPYKTSSGFLGWFDANGDEIGVGKEGDIIRNITGDVTVYAKWAYSCNAVIRLNVLGDEMCPLSEKEKDVTKPQYTLPIRSDDGGRHYILLSEHDYPVTKDSRIKLQFIVGKDGKSYYAHDSTVVNTYEGKDEDEGPKK